MKKQIACLLLYILKRIFIVCSKHILYKMVHEILSNVTKYENYVLQYTIIFNISILYFRTKWKRQTAVGLELLAEAGNYAAVQRMLQSNPYWFTYHPQATSIISNFDALYYRQGESSLTSPRPTLPRMFIHGLQQHVNHLSPPSVFSPENRS